MIVPVLAARHVMGAVMVVAPVHAKKVVNHHAVSVARVLLLMVAVDLVIANVPVVQGVATHLAVEAVNQDPIKLIKYGIEGNF